LEINQNIRSTLSKLHEHCEGFNIKLTILMYFFSQIKEETDTHIQLYDAFAVKQTDNHHQMAKHSNLQSVCIWNPNDI